MIAYPETEGGRKVGRLFFYEFGGLVVSPDSHMLFWVTDGEIKWGVALHDWVGKTVQSSFVSRKKSPFPRALARVVSSYVYEVKELKMLYAVADSGNEAAIRLQRWIGFKELYRGEGLHEGGDLILSGMSKDDCRWLGRKLNG